MTNTILNHALVKLFFVISLAAGLILGVVLPLTPVVHAQGTTITVNSTKDETIDNGECTLRDAINSANNNQVSGFTSGECAAGVPGEDTIIFSVTGAIVLEMTGSGDDQNKSGDLDIIEDLIINGGGVITIDGDGIDRMLHISGTATAEINGLTITNGKSPDDGVNGLPGGGIRVESDSTLYIINSAVFSNSTSHGRDITGGDGGDGGAGGGVYNDGTLVISNSTLSDNSSGNGGEGEGGGNKGGEGGKGGGIYNNGTLVITNSTFSNNSAGDGGNSVHEDGNDAGEGGAIYNLGGLSITNSTVSSNTAGNGGVGPIGKGDGGNGGGIHNVDTTIIHNSTIVSNTTGNSGGGVATHGQGGGIMQQTGAITIKNTILARNVASGGNPDCAMIGGTFTSQGYNLVENTGTCATVGTDVTGQDPKLYPLANNGGETQTHALQSDSPAIDGAQCGSGLATDQRGKLRVVQIPWINHPNEGSSGDGCDIGAYEAQPELSLAKTVFAPTNSPGDRITYTIVMSNSGDLKATNAAVSDTLDDHLTFVGPVAINPPQNIETSGAVTISGITITSKQRVTLTFPVIINTSVETGTIITNTAWLSSAEIIIPAKPGAGGIPTITVGVTSPGVYLPLIVKDKSPEQP